MSAAVTTRSWCWNRPRHSRGPSITMRPANFSRRAARDRGVLDLYRTARQGRLDRRHRRQDADDAGTAPAGSSAGSDHERHALSDRLGCDAKASQGLCRSGGELRHIDGPAAFDRNRERRRSRLRLLCRRARIARHFALASGPDMSALPRRIAVVTGSRADYGLLRGMLRELRRTSDVDLRLIVCGMHLADKFGATWRAIEADGFPIAAKIDLQLNDDRPGTIARGSGVG